MLLCSNELFVVTRCTGGKVPGFSLIDTDNLNAAVADMTSAFQSPVMSPDAQATGGRHVCTIEIARRDRLAPCRGRCDPVLDTGQGPGAVRGAGQDRLLHVVDWPAVAKRQAGAARHEDLGGGDQRQGRPTRAPGQAHLLRRSECGGPPTRPLPPTPPPPQRPSPHPPPPPPPLRR